LFNPSRLEESVDETIKAYPFLFNERLTTEQSILLKRQKSHSLKMHITLNTKKW
jgi:hypothetical protein